MLGRKQEINLQFSLLMDAALLVAAFIVAYQLRLAYPSWWIFSGDPISEMERFYWLVAVVAGFTPLALEYFGYYNHPLQKRPWPWVSLRQIAQAGGLIAILIGAIVIFAQKSAESRAVLALHLVLAPFFLLGKEWLVRAYLRRRARHGGWREHIVLAGSPEEMAELINNLPKETENEVSIVAKIDITTAPIEDFVEKLHEVAAERVIIAAGHLHFDKVQKVIYACEVEGVEAWLATDFVKTSIARPTFDAFAGKPMLVFRSTPEASWALMMKRLLDITVSIILLIFPGLLFLVIAWIGIKLQSRGPVFFKQQRSGKNGRPFTMYKFRTMHTDAEQRRAELEAMNQMSGPVFKIENDPRIFPFGRFLRKFSIDEWPQFINVLRGEMSLVGPRPLPVYEVQQFSAAAQRRRLSVKPGLTCLWQIRGRNEIKDFDEWVALDLEYIDNWSFWLDISILIRTIPAVLCGSGAK